MCCLGNFGFFSVLNKVLVKGHGSAANLICKVSEDTKPLNIGLKKTGE